MSLTRLAAVNLGRAKPALDRGSRYRGQDAALAALGRAEHCPSCRSLASIPDDEPAP